MKVMGNVLIKLTGFQAAVVFFGVLGMACGMFVLLRWLERSRDRFGCLLMDEVASSDEEIPSDWSTEYTNPMLLGVPQFGVRFQTSKTQTGLFLRKHRSLTGGTSKGVVFLPEEKYLITRQFGRLNISRKVGNE
jgi:hypothetical protein